MSSIVIKENFIEIDKMNKLFVVLCEKISKAVEHYDKIHDTCYIETFVDTAINLSNAICRYRQLIEIIEEDE